MWHEGEGKPETAIISTVSKAFGPPPRPPDFAIDFRWLQKGI